MTTAGTLIPQDLTAAGVEEEPDAVTPQDDQHPGTGDHDQVAHEIAQDPTPR